MKIEILVDTIHNGKTWKKGETHDVKSDVAAPLLKREFAREVKPEPAEADPKSKK